MLLSEAKCEFIEYIRYRRNATDATIVTYSSNLGMFVLQVGDMPCDALELATIDDYAKYLSTLNLKPKTFRNRLTIVRSFVKYLYAQNLTNIRHESIELPKNREAIVTYLTEQEINMLFTACTGRVRDNALLHVLFTSGLRVGELCNLTRSNILGNTISVINGKGMKHRVTFMSDSTLQLLSGYLDSHTSDYIFPNPSGNQMSRMGVLKIVKKAATEAGIQKRVTVHTLRHTFATYYLLHGGRVEDLQLLMGHTNLNTTMLYLHFTDSHLLESHRKIDFIG